MLAGSNAPGDSNFGIAPTLEGSHNYLYNGQAQMYRSSYSTPYLFKISANPVSKDFLLCRSLAERYIASMPIRSTGQWKMHRNHLARKSSVRGPLRFDPFGRALL